MSFLIFLKNLKQRLLILIFRRKPEPPPVIDERPKLSLLIPYRKSDKQRDLVLKWLLKYWKAELPDAEIIIGRSKSKIFSKTEAFNDAARKSTGKVLVLLDADAYISGKVLDRAATRILDELDNHLWYVPYRKLYRLNRFATNLIIYSDPANPFRVPSPPPKNYLEDNGDKAGYGHRYGAMVMEFPREAFDILGGFDERFKGWGGEDVAILRALDTLYGKHKITNNDVLHLHHPVIGKNYKDRMWKGQQKQLNSELASKYNRATRNPSKMRELVEEGKKKKK